MEIYHFENEREIKLSFKVLDVSPFKQGILLIDQVENLPIKEYPKLIILPKVNFEGKKNKNEKRFFLEDKKNLVSFQKKPFWSFEGLSLSLSTIGEDNIIQLNVKRLEKPLNNLLNYVRNRDHYHEALVSRETLRNIRLSSGNWVTITLNSDPPLSYLVRLFAPGYFFSLFFSFFFFPFFIFIRHFKFSIFFQKITSFKIQLFMAYFFLK